MDDGRIMDDTSISRCGTPYVRAESRPAAPATSLGKPAASRPQDCPLCGSDLVYPTDWRQVDASGWDLELRCPECHTARAVSLCREDMHRFNLLLYRSAEVLTREAEELTRQCAIDDEAYCSALVDALNGDLILPMDF
jgi:hypothetical protein